MRSLPCIRPHKKILKKVPINRRDNKIKKTIELIKELIKGKRREKKKHSDLLLNVSTSEGVSSDNFFNNKFPCEGTLPVKMQLILYARLNAVFLFKFQ